VRAGLLTAHTPVATQVFCGMSPADAAQASEQRRPDQPVPARPAATGGTDVPAYEVWRQRLADEFVSLGRS
jgi:enediyne biosynthesis protein E3